MIGESENTKGRHQPGRALGIRQQPPAAPWILLRPAVWTPCAPCRAPQLRRRRLSSNACRSSPGFLRLMLLPPFTYRQCWCPNSGVAHKSTQCVVRLIGVAPCSLRGYKGQYSHGVNPSASRRWGMWIRRTDIDRRCPSAHLRSIGTDAMARSVQNLGLESDWCDMLREHGWAGKDPDGG
jgi:hypothetical protein